MDQPSQDVPSEITLDDFMADEQTAPKAEAKAESSPKQETPVPNVLKTEVEGEAPQEPKETPEPPKEEDAKPAEVQAEEPKPEDDATLEEKPTKADDRKQQLNTEIRDLVAQRNSLKTEVEKINSEVYQVATEDELVEQGLSATDAKVEALNQRLELKDYNDRVAEAQLSIGHESQRVLQDFAIFNPESTEYDKELAEEAAGLMESQLILDPHTNQVIGTHVSPYTLYKTLARASGISATKGRQQGQQDTQTMLANADTASSAAPPKVKSDPLMELWKSED